MVAQCSSCQARECTQIELLRVGASCSLAHVVCAQCQHALLAHVERKEQGIYCVGIVTDLSVQDAQASMERRCLGVDDVLGIHEAVTDGSLLTQLSGHHSS